MDLRGCVEEGAFVILGRGGLDFLLLWKYRLRVQRRSEEVCPLIILWGIRFGLFCLQKLFLIRRRETLSGSRRLNESKNN